MRLYLSSFRLGNHSQSLVELAKHNRRAVVIVNACDFMSKEERKVRLEQEIAALTSIGFSAAELDLRAFFGRRSSMRETFNHLASVGLVWVRGGNSFVLRRAMKSSGFDKKIRRLLESDALVYGGYSAGIDMLTPSLQGVELVDDPNVVPKGYEREIHWECLGLVPYFLAPHYKSEHPESDAASNLVQYYIDNHLLFKALRDGQVIVINGNHEEILL